MTAPLDEASAFIGRRNELQALRRALEKARLITLIGAGGVGKTRLARQLLSERAVSEPVWTADLSQVIDPDVVQIAVADAMGLRPQPGDRQVELIAGMVGSRRALLLLDNCEQVLLSCVDLVADLLARCPRLRVLATSRQPLGIRGEHVYRVPPLSVPLAEGRRAARTTAEVAAAESVALFVERARDALPEFELTDANASDVANLCRLLDGVPLALELAAARTRVLSPAAIARRLTEHSLRLQTDVAGQPERHRSLEASVRWSHDSCSEHERLLWRRLSVFSGGFGLEAAEEVCSDEQLPRAQVLEVLSSLVDKSIVFRDPQAEPPHYRMLEPLRHFGATELEQHDRAEGFRRRHRQHVVELANDINARWVGPDQPGLLALLHRNRGNLRLLLEHCTSGGGEATTAMRVCVDLEACWTASGRLSEGRHWLQAALSHDEGPPELRAAAQAAAAYLATVQHELAEARDMLDLARADAVGSSDSAEATRAFARIDAADALLHISNGSADEAVSHAERSLRGYLTVGDLAGEVKSRAILAMALNACGRSPEGRAVLWQALDRTAHLGERYMHSMSLWLLSLDERAAGELDEAERHAVEALLLKAGLGDQMGSALVLEALASVASVRGDASRAATLLGAAEGVWGQLGMSAYAAPYVTAQRQLGRRLAEAGLHDRAFAAAFGRGRALSNREVLELVHGPRNLPHPLEESPLTSREREVAMLLGEGLSNQEVADRLVVSLRTAQGHVENILRKLGLQSRAQVAAWVVTRTVRNT